MRWMKWIGLAAAVILVFSCFNIWVVINSANIVVTGIDAGAVSLGKPGYLHFIFCFFFFLFSFIQKIWAKRFNLPVTALNLAWAIRNYLVVSACSWGECPVKHIGLYLLLPTSLLMFIAALLPDLDRKTKSIKKV